MGANDIETSKTKLQEHLQLIFKIPEKLNKIDIDIKKELIFEIEERKLSLLQIINNRLIACKHETFEHAKKHTYQLFNLYELEYLQNLIQTSIDYKTPNYIFEAEQIVKNNLLENNITLVQKNKNPYRDKIVFKIALTFATGEAQKLYKEYPENEYGVFTKIAEQLGFSKTDHAYFSFTLNNKKDDNSKNLYRNKKAVNEIYSYYKEKGLELHKDFLDKVDLNER
jgi:hypothetical protein